LVGEGKSVLVKIHVKHNEFYKAIKTDI